jgi:hypothetical protein
MPTWKRATAALAILGATAEPATAGWLDWLKPDMTALDLTHEQQLDKAMMEAVTGEKLTAAEYRQVEHTIPCKMRTADGWYTRPGCEAGAREGGRPGTGLSHRHPAPQATTKLSPVSPKAAEWTRAQEEATRAKQAEKIDAKPVKAQTKAEIEAEVAQAKAKIQAEVERV